MSEYNGSEQPPVVKKTVIRNRQMPVMGCQAPAILSRVIYVSENRGLVTFGTGNFDPVDPCQRKCYRCFWMLKANEYRNW